MGEVWCVYACMWEQCVSSDWHLFENEKKRKIGARERRSSSGTHSAHFSAKNSNVLIDRRERKQNLKYTTYFSHEYQRERTLAHISGSPTCTKDHIHADTRFAIKWSIWEFSPIYSLELSASLLVAHSIAPRYANQRAHYSMQPKSNYIIRIKLVKLASTMAQQSSTAAESE